MAVISQDWRAFFERGKESFDGVFTLQKYDDKGNVINAPVKRLKARSGARNYFKTEWVVGHSPIPRGNILIRAFPNNIGQTPGERGIGEFYPCSTNGKDLEIWENQLGNPAVPVGANTRRRTEIGIHGENSLPGSAGCIVIVDWDDFQIFRKTMKEIKGSGVTHVPLKVF